jgi:single-strand DNA-binding protein
MRGYNQLTIMGNLGSQPEMRYTGQGKAITSFSVAVSRKYEDKEETEWFRVVAWDKLAEACNESLFKGDPVFVVGRVHLNSWLGTDKQKHARLELIASTITFLSKKHEDTVNDVMADAPEESASTEVAAEVPGNNGHSSLEEKLAQIGAEPVQESN